MVFSAQQIADFLQGEIEGDKDISVSNFSKIEEGKPGTLSFLSNPKYEPYLYETKSSIVLVNKDFVPSKKTSATLIRVKDSYQALARLLTLYESTKPKKKGVHNKAIIAKSSQLGKDVFIDAFVVVGENVNIGNNVKIYSNCNIGDNVTIGNDTILYPNVTVYENCKIAGKCILQAGCVIGSDGFGFAPQSEDYAKIPQIGNVILEEGVEIGANTVIDRATMGSTIIRKGVKLDNLIQIAHNVEVGENTVMAAQTGIAGSTKIGKNCMMGGQVGIAGHVNIADNSKFGAQSGVSGAVKKEGSILLGSPAIDIVAYRKSYAVFKSLPDMSRTLYQLEREIKELKEQLKKD